MKKFKTMAEAGMAEESWPMAEKWLARGDGVAVYENVALDSAQLGHRVFLSYGSKKAQLEMETPPVRCPDISGVVIGWKYQLVGVVRPEGKEVSEE